VGRENRIKKKPLQRFSRGGSRMSHSLVRIWVHAIWGTKEKQPLMKDDFREEIIKHIKESFEEQDCTVQVVNGTTNHLHALFMLPQDQSMGKIIQMVKGETSHWINQQNFLQVKFAWQQGYGGFSVSGSMIGKVTRYIRIQEEHHRKMTFREEYDRFMKGFQSYGNR
jgi:putative transposase